MDLAGEVAILDEAQAHGWRPVAQGVGDQFADDLFRGVGGALVHAPGGELGPGVPARDRRGGGVVVQGPGGGGFGGEGVGAGEEKDGIAREGVAAQPVEDVVAQVLEGPVGVGEYLPEQWRAAGAVLGPVGGRQRGRVEGEEIPVGDGDGGGGERGAAPAVRSTTRGVSSGPASMGGGCPAEAMAQVRENGSYITHRHVALRDCLFSGSAQGLSNAEICARLVVSQATAKTHINRIFAKTGATDRAQAVGYAYRNDLVDGG